MSTNNVNIVNTNNWYQKMNTNGNQNVTNMVVSGTNPSVQMTLINSANDTHYLYSNYPFSTVNGFTMSFQFYISGTASNLTWLNAFFGTLDYNVSAPNLNTNNEYGVELIVNPGQYTYGYGDGSRLQIISSGVSSTYPVVSNNTSVTASAWQTVSITFNPSGTTNNFVVSYNGTTVLTYNYSSNVYGSPIGQNTCWGIGASTGGTPATVYIRNVDLSIKQSIPLSLLKNTYSFYPEECFINKLSTYSQNNVAAAYGLRLLKANYLGPIINVRRGSDNATLDFYADIKGNLGTNLYGGGTTLLSWLDGSIGYVTRWYDQTNNGRDVINSTQSGQPKIGTPLLDKMSSSGKSAARGIYALYRANSTYFGPTIRLRRSADNVTADFYSDVYGNLNNSLTVNNSVNTWSARTSNMGCQGIAWSPQLNLFAATNYNAGNATTNAIQTSPDGINWTTRTTPSIAKLSYIVWSQELSLFVATSYQGGTSNVITSPDGINWTQRTAPNIADGISAGLGDIAWSPQLSLFVCVNQRTTTNTNWVITSPDGINWTQQTTPSANKWIGVCWSRELSLFVAVNYNISTTSGVATSPDGITWTIRTTPSVSSLCRVRWSPQLNLFVAVGSSCVITSPDGINWTSRTTLTGDWNGLVWNPDLSIFAACRTNVSTNCIMTSPDGINWTYRTTPSTQCWDITWSPALSTFVAVNPNNTTLITSAQGLVSNSTYSSWIGSSTAYVDTWYDQSGSANHATQSTNANQPVYNSTLKLIDSQNSSSQCLNIPSGTVPTGTLNAPYSFVFKHGTFNNTNGTFISGGIWSNSQSNVIRLYSNQPNGYANYWYANDFTFGSNTAVTGNTIAITYNGSLQNGYVNGTLSSTNSSHTGGTTAAGQQYLFRSPGGEYLNGQMYSVFIFGSALSDSDRFACTSNPIDINIKYDGAQNLYMPISNYPLSAGLKAYTYACNVRIDNYYGGIVEQSASPLANNTRAGLYSWLPTAGYGFVGHNNDTGGVIPYGTFVNRKIVMMCNHNLSSGNIVFNDNGSIYTATSTTPTNLSVGTGAFTIGSNGVGGELFTGIINEVVVFRNTLTTKESELYFTPNAITLKNYRSQPRLQIKDIPKDISPLPTGAVVSLDTQMLQNMSPNSLVSSWNGFTGYNNPVLNDATYNVGAVVYNIPPYVSLVNGSKLSSDTSGQYLNAGSKTFNINTNGGFTAIWFGTFTGTASASERIFDFGNGENSNNLIALRGGTSTSIYFFLQNGNTQYFISSNTGVIVQNEYAVWTFRYTASSKLMEILKNGVSLVTGTAGAAIADKTLSNTWIGRSQWQSADYYSNMNTVGLYVYDRFLTDAQVASVSNHLMYCTTASMPNTLPDYNNKVVRYGSVLSQGYRGGQAMYFSGKDTNSYLDIQDIPNWPLTFCFWFNLKNDANAFNISPAALCSADLAGAGIQFDISDYGTTIKAAYHNGSNYTQFTNSTIALNTWYHIAFVVTPTTAAYYLGGSLIQSVSVVIPNTNRLIIGKSGDNARPMQGYISDIRVFDYALRADEISAISSYAGGAGQEIMNYNTPANYLVNVSNWYSIMNVNKTGTFAITSGESDPNVYFYMTANGSSYANSSNTIFNSTKIQNYNSFVCSFLAYVDTATDHGFYFYCGATSSTTVPTGTTGTAANSSYYVYFSIAGTRGVYLFNDQGQQLAYSPVSASLFNSSVYIPVTITYNRSVKNTWTVNISSIDVLTFSDQNNTNWVSNIAGDFWGIGGRTTTSGMNFYIRRVQLSYTPYTNSVSTVVNAQSNVKFPPAAMTAASTTFTGTGVLNGVYTASASNSYGAGINPYWAFDNSTSTYWGELNSYNNSGDYTGGLSTSIKNLTTNVSTSYSGEWLQLQVPNPVQLTSFSLMGRQDGSLYIWRTPKTFYVAGSNDGSTWELIHNTSGAQFTSAMQYFTCNSNNTNKYRYFRIIVSKIGNVDANGPGGPTIDIAAWDLYTQSNLINAGVIAIPPYSMTANTTTFSGNSFYDGTYILTSSNTGFGGNGGDIYTAFNDTYGTLSNTWGPGGYYNSSTGVYTGSISTTVSGVSQSGEWVQIQIPNPIVLYSFSLNFFWTSDAFWAKSFLIAASNDNSTWTNIYDNTNASFVYGTAQTFVVTGSPTPYKYFRLIVRSTSGSPTCAWWFLDQWKLYTNANNFNLMKFPPAPLTADTPVTFTTVNTKNWYNIGYIANTGGSFTPVFSESDPLKQLQLTDGRGGIGTGFAFGNQPVMNYNSFTFTFQLYCQNNSNGDWLQLYFGNGGYQQTFGFSIYYYQGIQFNGINSPTNWYNSTWNNIRVEYNRGPTNTWTMFFNETQIIQYSDPNWASTPGGTWGFNTFNGAATFTSYIRGLEMTINDSVSLPGNSIVSGSYISSASSVYNNQLDCIPSGAFGNFLNWHSGLNYTASNGLYAGAVSTTVSGTSYSGDWIQLQTPNPLILHSFSIYPRQDGSFYAYRSPRNFVMAGSNDSSTWYLLHTATGVNDWTSSDKYFVCNGTNVTTKYSYFRLIVMAVGNPYNVNSSNCVNIINLSLFTPITLNNSITPATPKGLLDGLTWKFYNGYFSDNVSYYTTNTYINIGRCVDTTNLTKITNGQIAVVNNDQTFSMELFGYFRATVSGTWTFSLASDDGSFLWIGSNALTGYTTSNANIIDGGVHSVTNGQPKTCTITLLAGNYYPIRIQYGQNTGNDDLQFSFTPPGGTQTYNGQGYFFSGTGVDAAFPQESAKIIKDLTCTNTDGIYYILVNGKSTPIHCLMNDCYDGGGWMMLMKGTRGTTFGYSSSYWSNKNTLNANDLTRNDADAKYNTYNYSTVKDVLAIFPDISPTSYTNPYGQNGGSIFVNDGWTWMVNNWNETTRITPFTGFNTTRLPHQNSSNSFSTYGINNPFRYNGFGGWCYTETASYQHVFYSTGNNANVRWGFLFNNESNDLTSCDTFCGIGMGGEVSYSAGDWGRGGGNWGGQIGINRTARFELYGR